MRFAGFPCLGVRTVMFVCLEGCRTLTAFPRGSTLLGAQVRLPWKCGTIPSGDSGEKSASSLFIFPAPWLMNKHGQRGRRGKAARTALPQSCGSSWLLSLGAAQALSGCPGVSLPGSRAAQGTHVLKQLPPILGHINSKSGDLLCSLCCRGSKHQPRLICLQEAGICLNPTVTHNFNTYSTSQSCVNRHRAIVCNSLKIQAS